MNRLNTCEWRSNSRTILASKIYNIVELEDGINGEEYMCIPKEPVYEEVNYVDVNQDDGEAFSALQDTSTNDMDDGMSIKENEIDLDENFAISKLEDNSVDCELTDESFFTSSLPANSGSNKKAAKKVNNTAVRRLLDEQMILFCPFCGERWYNISKWREHLDEVHAFLKQDNPNLLYLGNDLVKCLSCNLILNSKKTVILERHLITHLPYNKFAKCKLCPAYFGRINLLKIHLRQMHEMGSELKKKSDNSNPQRNTQNLLYLRYGIYCCPFCGVDLSFPVDWHRHLNEMHGFNERKALNFEFLSDNVAQCKLCKMELNCKSIKSLQNHSICHQRFNLYLKCKLCDRKFGRSNSFRAHLSRAHSKYAREKILPTTKEPPTEYGENSREDEMFQVADTVPEASNSSLRGALREENEEGFYKNSIVSKEKTEEHHSTNSDFISASFSMDSIPDKQISNASYESDVSREPDQRISLEDNKIFLCLVCGQEFTHTTGWREHLNETHAFHRRESLNVHYVDKNIVKCTICNYEMSSKRIAVLQKHMVKHLPYTKYAKCKLCQRVFSHLKSLNIHLISCHKATPNAAN